MPWEKSFNIDKAIESAMILFWEKGYSDSSMTNLLDVTGLTKGSFYNAFGSKRDLFLKALLKYDQDMRRSALQKLIAMDDPKKAIEAFFDTNIRETAGDCDKKGCFIINTSLDLASHDKDIQKIVTKAFSETENFFKQMIKLGQERGDISKTINPDDTAKSLVGTLVAIRVLGRGVYDKADLQALSEQAANLLH